MSGIDHNLDDELLSAFIDGELDDAERAVVEARLENDPAARQLVAELRTLRGTLQSLPRETLTEDLRGAVMSQIGDQLVALPPVRLSPTRRLLWPALAIATALLLMFISEDQIGPVDEVAQVEEADVDRSGQMPRGRMAGERSAAFEAAEPPQPRQGAARPATSPPLADESSALAATASPSRELVADGVQSEPVADEAELAVVHLTLTDFPSGAEHFHRLLLANGVQLVEGQIPPASAAATESPLADTLSAGAAAGANALSTRGAGQARGFDSAERMSTAQSSGPPTARPETEMVLVEAAPEQIKQILAECAEETEAIAEVAVDPTAGGTNSAPLAKRLIDYQQYSRSAAARGQVQSYAVTPEQQGVIAALNSLRAEQRLSDSGVEKARGQGWAARVPTDQRPEQWQQLNAQYKQFREQNFDQDLSSTAPKEGTSQDPRTMRMLFLLHPSDATH